MIFVTRLEQDLLGPVKWKREMFKILFKFTWISFKGDVKLLGIFICKQCIQVHLCFYWICLHTQTKIVTNECHSEHLYTLSPLWCNYSVIRHDIYFNSKYFIIFTSSRTITKCSSASATPFIFLKQESLTEPASSPKTPLIIQAHMIPTL